MNESLFFSNLLTWNMQIALVVVASAVLQAVLRIRDPKARLAFWQLVLIACLMLPFLRAWKQETIIFAVLGPTAPVSVAITQPRSGVAGIPITSWVPLVLAVGALARLGWLVAGFWRMARYRRNSVPLSPAPRWATEEADLRISEDVQSPVTFGFLIPVVLLPTNFCELGESTQEAILCHEIVHVRRKDWLFTVAEELFRSVLWFQPAVWWVLGEIQLAREQAVDREVIGMTRSRDRYVDALLTVAGANPLPDLATDLATAPLFLRKRHLKARVVSILKEVHMSKTRTVSALAASLVLLAASCWFVTGAMPLYGAPQITSDSAGVAVEMNGAQLMHRNSVSYPMDAISKKVEGVVTVQVKLDGKGNVSDASIVSGPEELRKSVLQSVLGWHFAKPEANSTRQVAITFQLPKEMPATAPAPSAAQTAMVRSFAAEALNAPRPPMPPPATLKAVSMPGNQDRLNELMAMLPVHIGDTLTPELMSKSAQVVREYDEHLRLSFRTVSPTETEMVINTLPETTQMLPPPGAAAGGANPIRVGGNVQTANLVSQVNPEYPPLAKAARVQGTVRFDVTIGMDGKIEQLHLISGPPLLVQAAMQAVQQWVYRPTLLNGSPVKVTTTIDINFTLPQE